MDDLEIVEQRVFPLMTHVTTYLRRTVGRGTKRQRRDIARMRNWCFDIMTLTRSAYRRTLQPHEQATLQILCDKLFSRLPRAWQRIGSPPTP